MLKMKTISGLSMSIDHEELAKILDKQGWMLVKKEPEPEYKVGDYVHYDPGVYYGNNKTLVFRVKNVGETCLESEDNQIYYKNKCRHARQDEIKKPLPKTKSELMKLLMDYSCDAMFRGRVVLDFLQNYED
jgi:hypothetical protein